MARVIGSGAGGYATVTPTENYVGQALQNVEANAFRYREQQREEQAKRDALARAKQEAEQKARERELDDNDKLNAIRAKDSGISGINSAIQNGLQDRRQKFLEADRNYRTTGDRKYLIERSNAMNDLHTIANLPEVYKQKVDEITKGYEAGTISRSELNKITALSDKIEKGFVVPKIENGSMTFDIFDRDPQTGKLSSVAVSNMKGEELLSQLTPRKKFDYTKHIGEMDQYFGKPVTSIKNGMEITDYANKGKIAQAKANQLLTDKDLLDDVAQFYDIDEEDGGGYSDENKKIIQNRYIQDLLSSKASSSKPNYEAERIAIARQNANRLASGGSGEKSKAKAFRPPTGTALKTGIDPDLGISVTKGNKVFGPTYKEGKEGPIKGVVLNDDGSYSFSIGIRKDDSLNQKGQANKKAWEKKPENAGKEYKPLDTDYRYPSTKPTVLNSRKDSEINGLVRGMLNPSTGENFENFAEYKAFYDRYKPKKSTSAVASKVKSVAKTAAKTPTKKSKDDPLGLGV